MGIIILIIFVASLGALPAIIVLFDGPQIDDEPDGML
jgi:hypothetical protein